MNLHYSLTHNYFWAKQGLPGQLVLHNTVMKMINIEVNLNPKALIMDPFCIRAKMLLQRTTYIKNNVRERLPSICHNPEITKMLSLDNNEPIDHIVEVLQTLTPFMATCAHEILRNFNAGLVEQFQTRLTNIPTINKIVEK